MMMSSKRSLPPLLSLLQPFAGLACRLPLTIGCRSRSTRSPLSSRCAKQSSELDDDGSRGGGARLGPFRQRHGIHRQPREHIPETETTKETEHGKETKADWNGRCLGNVGTFMAFDRAPGSIGIGASSRTSSSNLLVESARKQFPPERHTPSAHFVF